MDIASLFLWLLAATLALIAFSRRGDALQAGVTYALGQFIVVLPRVICALVTAGFVAAAVPSELIAAWLGGDSGFAGLLTATLIGALIPAGPVIVFPVAVMLAASGAAVPQLIAFVTAWSIFAVHRVIIFEIPLIGWRFTALRLTSSCALPVIAGLLAGLG